MLNVGVIYPSCLFLNDEHMMFVVMIRAVSTDIREETTHIELWHCDDLYDSSPTYWCDRWERRMTKKIIT